MIMKAVHVISRFSPSHWGGAEEVVWNLAGHQAAQNYEVQVLTTKDAVSRRNGLGATTDAELTWTTADFRVRCFSYLVPASNADLRHVWVSRGIHMVSPTMAMAMLALPRRATVAHLHLHNGITTTAAFCCLLRGIPYILHLHSRYDVESGSEDCSWLRLPRRVFSHHEALRRAASILCLTEPQATRLRELLPGKNVLAVPNGVEPRRFTGGNSLSFRKKYGLQDRVVLLNVAKVYPLKNQFFLIRLLMKLKKRLPNAALVLVGYVEDHEYFSRIQQEICRLGLEKDVRVIPGLPPNSQELRDAYAGADCFLLPSLEESFALVVLEAWVNRLPVVASVTEGTSSLLRSGLNGLLVSSFRELDWIASITKVVGDGAFRQTLVENGCNAASTEYSWKNIAERIECLYQAVAKK